MSKICKNIVCRKCEGIWKKYVDILNLALPYLYGPWDLRKFRAPPSYSLWDLEQFRSLHIYMGFGIWKNSTPKLPPGLWDFKNSELPPRLWDLEKFWALPLDRLWDLKIELPPSSIRACWRSELWGVTLLSPPYKLQTFPVNLQQ